MPNLFALLVAINQYHRPEIADLAGPLNDLAGIEHSLARCCRGGQGLSLQAHALRGKDATRQAVIDGFRLFEQAGDGDVCLFYFSGHGSQVAAPPEFPTEADQMLEALVCLPDASGERLLLDKELAWLIWNAQRGRDVHFLVIADNCHSGSNTKDPGFRVRSAPPDLERRPVDAFLGRADYQEIRDPGGKLVRLAAPTGKHFKLSACAPGELAKEKPFGRDGKTRGAFTFALLEALREDGLNLSYANLLRKVRLKTQALVSDQSPQIELVAVLPQESSRAFLNGVFAAGRPTFQVCYNPAQRRWEVDAGQAFGACPGDAVVLADGTEVEIKKAYVAASALDPAPLHSHPHGKVYDAFLRPASRQKLNLAFSPGSDPAACQTLLDLVKEAHSAVLSFAPARELDYLVQAGQGALALTHPAGGAPVFARLHGQGRAEARLFLNIVAQIAEWRHIVALRNTSTSIRDDELELDLRRVESPHRHQNPDLAPAVSLDLSQGEHVFRYHFDESTPGGPWHPPAFRLSLASRSAGRKLWVSALYCGSGYTFARTHYASTAFSLTNRFLEKELLEKEGQVARLVDEVNDPAAQQSVAFESIQLSVLDDYYDQGYNEIKDLVKIFVSTEELDLSPFNMEGLPIDTEGLLASKPGMPARRRALPDWRTYELPITIVRPRDIGLLSAGLDKQFHGVTIRGHPTFTARVVLSTLEEFRRGVQPAGLPRPEILFGSDNVLTLALTPGLGPVEGCRVIEFFRPTGQPYVDEDRPLIFKIDPRRLPVPEGRRLVLAGYSAPERAYLPLGTMDAGGEIRLAALPAESPALIDGLGGSIKLFLWSVRSDFDFPTRA